MVKMLYQFLKEKIYFCFDLIRKKGRDFFINLKRYAINYIIKLAYGFRKTAVPPSKIEERQRKYKEVSSGEKSNNLANIAANALVEKELDKYLISLRPLMPLLNYDPAIKTMKIEWNTSLTPPGIDAHIKERLEEQIINRYVRYVSKHIFALLPPNEHKILLNATAYEQLGNYQIPIGEQVLYKDPQQLENYLIDQLMGVLVSYGVNGMEDFIYFISDIDEKQYEELSTKIQALFKERSLHSPCEC